MIKTLQNTLQGERERRQNTDPADLPTAHHIAQAEIQPHRHQDGHFFGLRYRTIDGQTLQRSVCRFFQFNMEVSTDLGRTKPSRSCFSVFCRVLIKFQSLLCRRVSVCRFFQFNMEVIPLEVRINKEVRDYQESLFFGLSLRQFLFALLAVLKESADRPLQSLSAYGTMRQTRKREVCRNDVYDFRIWAISAAGWICVLAAFPFALGGFFTYNGMTFEKFLLAVIRSELLYPRKLVSMSMALYSAR